MRVKLVLAALLAISGIHGQASIAQTVGFQSEIEDTAVGQIYPVGFTNQDEDDAAAALEEKLEKWELRLQELEDDVEKKIDSQKKAAAEKKDDSKDFSERLKDLEEGFEKSQKSLGKVEDTLPGLMYHGHKNPKMQFFGRIHLDYWAFPKFDDTLDGLESGGDPEDRWNFRRLRIGIKGDLTDNMFYKYEGEFAGANGSTSYRDAFIGFKDVPRLGTVIIGNHKRPYGLDHLNSSRHNVFIERPFAVEAFNQDARRMGISANGLSDDQSTNWRFGYWNQVLTQESGGYIGDDYQGEIAGRLAKTYWYDESSGGRGWAHVAISGSVGDPGTGRDPRTAGADYRTRPEARSTSRWLDTGDIDDASANYLIGLESAFNIGQLNVTSEYLRVGVDRGNSGAPDLSFSGYYSQVSYFLTGEHRTWKRKTGTLDRVKPLENFFVVCDCDGQLQRGWGAWELAARYSYADLSDGDVLGGEGESLTLGLNWYWNAYARMQFNYINGEISNTAGGQDGDYEIFGVRMMVDF
jgi:phosphate-selective porin OprO/OprP